jgi:urease beta subunit
MFVARGQQTMDLRTVQETAHYDPRPSIDFLEFETSFAPTSRFKVAPLNAIRYRGVESGVEIVDSEGTHCAALLGVSVSHLEKLTGTELVELFTSESLREFVPDDYSYYSDLPLVNCLVIKWEGRFAKKVAIAQVIQESWRKVKTGGKKVFLV